MADIDFDRVNVLLSVVHQCASVGPQVAQISSAAQAELSALNESLKTSDVSVASAATKTPVARKV
jgi:hypothetical protein